MYKDLLRSITGIEIFPIISLCVFLAVFIIAVVKAWRLDSRSVERLSNLPLEGPNIETLKKEVTQ